MVNSGEYKLMGLAPYGDPDSEQTIKFKEKILDKLADVKDDGSLLLNMDYFHFATGMRMTNDHKWQSLFGLPPRHSEGDISQEYANLALAIQQVTEDIVLKLAKHARDITNSSNLTIAGGVALNCVSNGKLLKTGWFNDIWVQPAAGDAGGAIGSALAAWYIYKEHLREPELPDGMYGSLLGPEYTDKEILHAINKYDAKARFIADFDSLCTEVASRLEEGNVVGWFQGRMEFGPRALGNRSILGDPRNPDMQKKLNLKIKYREGFRPFAPAVLEEDLADYFDLSKSSPYMLLVAPVKNQRRNPVQHEFQRHSLMQRLYNQRSDIPAVTHIDYSARIQSVDPKINRRFHRLISKFKELTNYSILVNTSFNVRGEPIVCTPEDAYSCFMSTEMDYLVMGNYLFNKQEQPDISEFSKGAKGND